MIGGEEGPTGWKAVVIGAGIILSPVWGTWLVESIGLWLTR